MLFAWYIWVFHFKIDYIKSLSRRFSFVVEKKRVFHNISNIQLNHQKVMTSYLLGIISPLVANKTNNTSHMCMHYAHLQSSRIPRKSVALRLAYRHFHRFFLVGRATLVPRDVCSICVFIWPPQYHRDDGIYDERCLLCNTMK